MLWRCPWTPLGLGLALVSGAAQAADENRPATRAAFVDVPCIEIVDRSVDPVFTVTYSVPMDDLGRTADEVADGRTLQFFAFPHHFLGTPPNWITWDDVERATVAPASAPESQNVQENDVLETSENWPADTWLRITADDARLPISQEQAALGVAWDTSEVDPGTYVIGAYTWDPARNAWSLRWGAVRVVDGIDDPASAPPTVFFPDQRGLVWRVGEEHLTPLCVDALPGSTLVASYALLEGAADPVWQPWLENAGVEGDEFELTFTPPDEAANRDVRLRVEIRDPQGRTYIAYSPNIGVIGTTGDDSDDNGGTEGETDSDQDTGSGGCRIASATDVFASMPMLLLPLLGWRRR